MIIEINEEISDILQLNSGILSSENYRKLKLLHERQEKFWAHEVTTHILKSRVQWIKEGDANTKFFHTFGSARRNSNTIWALNDKESNFVSKDLALKHLGEQHYGELFEDDGSTNFADQIKVIRLFPTLI